MNSYEVVYTPAAWKQIMALPDALQDAIFDVIETLELNPRGHGSKKLQGSKNSYRVRAGNYRILYEIEDKVLRVEVIKIGDRKEVYRKK
jgi:mRNA interferase RelE/StbE